RRFRHELAHRDEDDGRYHADQEHRLPAPMRDDEIGDAGDEDEAYREPELEAEPVAAAMRGFGELADIGSEDRDFAAEAEALDDAHPEQGVVIPGEGAGDAHQ